MKSSAPASRDNDGYLPIESYGVIGDGRSAALVGCDGRVDWWPIPTLDAPAVLAALLDPPRGGFFSLAPVSPSSPTQRYVAGTNVLETIHRTATGTVRVHDALTTGTAGRLPWSELARRVEGVSGTVELAWELRPGHRLKRAQPLVTRRNGVPVIVVEDQMLAVVSWPADQVALGDHTVTGRLKVAGGQTAIVAIVATDREPLPVPSPAAVMKRVEATVAAWRRWSALLPAGLPYPDAVARSALALKLLLTESTGAIAAAVTTSLPESICGPKNWDYRYSWVRDSSFALDALIHLGLHEEVHGAVSWLLDAIQRAGGDLRVFYTLGGDRPGPCAEIDLPGWRHSRPVRTGNSAADQTQLGTYGDLLDTIQRYSAEGHLLDEQTASMLAALADRCCDHWMDADSGIWELSQLRHYTISKIGCWTALDRAVSLARAGQLPDARAERWATTAAEIRGWVNEHCWSAKKRAYSFYAGTDELDAAVLLAGRTGFETGERLSSTIDAVAAELGRGSHVYRYSGAYAEEGAFVACSFWLIDALARTGRVEEALARMDKAVQLVNHAGLLAEQIDPNTGQFLGNFPQGLSHLALINAAFSIGKAAGLLGRAGR